MAAFDDLLAIHATPELKRLCGETVIYCRGALEVSIAATVERYEIAGDEQDGFRGSWEGYTFGLTAAALILTGLGTIVPAADDRILRGAASPRRVYVVSPPPDKRVSEPIDADGTEIFVFAKYVGLES
jgi:hypothetical protein